MKTLFLDVDGVLNRTGYTPMSRSDLPLADWLEAEPLASLVRLISETACDVVLSSSWRNRDPAEIRASFAAKGVSLPLVGMTPVLESPSRWEEIAAYLRENPQARRFVILDDEWTMGPLADWHVRISPLRGLNEGYVQEAKAILENGQRWEVESLA